MTRKTQKKLRKLLTLVCCAVMLVCVTVGATVAYLTSTDSVQNTFTVGNVTITLDEADVKKNGTYETTVDSRVDANEYHLMPGHSYIKDPTVHVDDESEESWLFVKVENGIAAIETSYDGVNADGKIADQMKTLGWSEVTGQSNIWAYKEKVQAGDDIVVFEGFKIDGDKAVDAYATAKNTDGTLAEDAVVVNIVAYAVQADGFETAAEALTEAPFPTTAG